MKQARLTLAQPDITPGWQERVAKLRELIRNCRHDGERLTNDRGQTYCGECCLILEVP